MKIVTKRELMQQPVGTVYCRRYALHAFGEFRVFSGMPEGEDAEEYALMSDTDMDTLLTFAQPKVPEAERRVRTVARADDDDDDDDAYDACDARDRVLLWFDTFNAALPLTIGPDLSDDEPMVYAWDVARGVHGFTPTSYKGPRS